MSFVNDLVSPLFSQGAHPEAVYRVGLILNGEYEDSKTSNLMLKDGESSCLKTGFTSSSSLPFTCEARFNSPGIPMQISDIFKIQPVFDTASGKYTVISVAMYSKCCYFGSCCNLFSVGVQVDMPVS